MQITEITDKKRWNDFLLQLRPNTFLQSYEWGQVQEEDGEKVRYLGLFEAGEQIGAALLVTVNARRGKFLLCPHGPLFQTEEQFHQHLPAFVEHCRAIRKEDGAAALRIAPLVETSRAADDFRKLKFRDAPLHIHAELTWVLDITPAEEELLSGMRKTTRQAVRKAEQEGVSVEITADPQAVERFWPLYETTKTRHQFVPFSKDFLLRQATEFAHDNRMYFAFAKYQGKDVVGALFVQFGDTVFYHHGASHKLPSSVPAAQLLHFASIKEAKRRGATRYNFWGIAPSVAPPKAGAMDGKPKIQPDPKHPFAGITTFKTGFGGYAIDYMHAQDLPLSPMYWKLWAVEMYRKSRRGF